MQIKITKLLEFNELDEHARIIQLFQGSIQHALLEVLNSFVQGNWTRCHVLLEKLSSEHLEYVHCTIFDVMKERGIRNASRSTYPEYCVNGKPL